MSTAHLTAGPPASRAAAVTREGPLVSRRRRRLLVLLGAMLSLAGFAAGVASLVRPAPQTSLVGLWISGSSGDWTMRETVAAGDRKALRDGGYFPHSQTVPAEAASRRLVLQQLAQLRQRGRSDRLVVYLAGRAKLNPQGQLAVVGAGGPDSEAVGLREVLAALRDSPAKHKLIVIDLAPPPAAAPWTSGTEDVGREVLASLDAVEDPHRLALCACSPQEAPLDSERWGRSGLGYFFEQALSGAADGWLDGRRDGRVSVRELTQYVQQHVAQWARTTHGASQTPLLVGQGGDFDLTAAALRDHPRPSSRPPAAPDRGEYPKWLAAAWNEQRQLHQRRVRELHPRLFHRWQQSILRAEQQWRGGRGDEQVQGELQRELAAHRTELRKAEAAAAPVEPFSLAQVQHASPIKEQPAADAALTQLLADISAKTESLPPDKAEAVREALIKKFLEDAKKIPDEALVAAALGQLYQCDRPAPQQVVLLDRLVRSRQPQPLYTETLLLRRLARLAEEYPPAWSPELAAAALRAGRLQGESAADDRVFAWTEGELREAAQHQHNGEYLLLRPGYGSPAAALEHLLAAERGYHAVASANKTFRHAYESLDAALLRLPEYFRWTGDDVRRGDTWLEAVEAACRLADAMKQGDGRPADGGDLVSHVDAIAAQADVLDGLLNELQRPLSDESIRRLAAQAGDADAPPALSSAIDNALRWPGLSVPQRKGLLAAKWNLDARLHLMLKSLSGRELPSPPARRAASSRAGAAKDSPLPGADAIARRLHAAADDARSTLTPDATRKRCRWWADHFAYRAHDDTPTLFAGLARRYGAAAGGFDEARLRIDGPRQLPRPDDARPEISAELQWQFLGDERGRTQADSWSVHPFADNLLVRSDASREGKLTRLSLELSRAAGESDGQDRGILVQVAAGGRTWHWPIAFEPRPWGSSLQILFSTDPTQPGETLTVLRFRPSAQPQAYYLSIANPTEQAANVTVEIPGVGETPLEIPPRAIAPLPLKPPPQPPAAAGEADQLAVRLRDTATGKMLHEQIYPFRVLSPSQYVRVAAGRFFPGEEGENRLTVTLAAEGLPAGPPCLVDLNLPPEMIPGLVAVTGGTLRGTLPADGSPLTLTAAGLRLIDGFSERAEFSLSVDGVPRALTFAVDLPRRGDPTSPRQVARPAISLSAPDYALAGPAFQATAPVLQGPANASVRLRIGQMTEAGFVSERELTACGPRNRRVQFAPQKDGGLAFVVALEDWAFNVDATGIVGPRSVVAELLEPGGRALATAQKTVVFDAAPPERAWLVDAPLEVLVKKPFKLQVAGDDAVSGVEKVFVFDGRAMDGKLPEGAKPLAATRSPDGEYWAVEHPPAKEAGPLEVTAQLVNRVGLSTFVTTQISVVERLSVAGGRIEGVVREGSRPQPRMAVTLLDGKNAVVATAQTDAAGAFWFDNLKPGDYRVGAVKEASGRRAQQAVIVAPGETAQAALELAL